MEKSINHTNLEKSKLISLHFNKMAHSNQSYMSDSNVKKKYFNFTKIFIF